MIGMLHLIWSGTVSTAALSASELEVASISLTSRSGWCEAIVAAQIRRMRAIKFTERDWRMSEAQWLAGFARAA
ncbi:hypothetical protein [Antarcticirhabdus aurantiaca]|uniref:Uncharacterized protein n=1 Tax=Antarcticirhabdus aurantiaca TaxID=2606717 RepID=A0ACD4NVV4_9HYPH|nr:hypothetical protein OXU80_12395 [Jeongeuplla avenae]